MLCVRYVSTRHARVKTLMDKKPKTVRHGFVEIVNESKRKPNKRVDQAGEFYKSSLQK